MSLNQFKSTKKSAMKTSFDSTIETNANTITRLTEQSNQPFFKRFRMKNRTTFLREAKDS